MALLHTLTSDFTAALDTSVWTLIYGGSAVNGGRLRVPIRKVSAGTPEYTGAGTASTWTLDGSQVVVEVPTAQAAGTGSEIWSKAIVSSTTDGTYLGFMIDGSAGSLVVWFQNATGHWDDTAPSVTFDPVAHRWWKLSMAGGTVTWATSPDGESWTTRRTLTTPPAWASGSNLALRFEGARSDGTDDFVEFDNLNLPPSVSTERLYLNADTPAVSPTLRGAWNVTAAASTRGLGAKSGAVANTLFTDAVATPNARILAHRAISDPIAEDRRYTGSMRFSAGALEGNAAMNAFTRVHAYVLAGDTDTVRGVLVANGLDDVEWGTTAAARGATFSVTEVEALAGDRIVIEFGAEARNSVATSYNGRFYWGGTGADLLDADTGANVSARVGWVELAWVAQADEPTLLVVDDARAPARADRPELAQHQPLASDGARSVARTEAALLAQAQAVTVDEPRAATRADDATLAQHQAPVSGRDVRAGTRAARPAVAQQQGPAVGLEARSATRATAPTLGQAYSLQVRGARSDSSASSLALEHYQPIAVRAADAATRAAEVRLEQSTPLAVREADAGTFTQHPRLTQSSTLVVGDARSTAGADVSTLDQHTPLEVDGARAATRADSPTVGQLLELALLDARAPARTESAVLAQHSELVVRPARSSSIAEQPWLSAEGFVQAHDARSSASVGRPLLTQHSALTVDDARSSSTATVPTVAPRTPVEVSGTRSAGRASSPVLTTKAATVARPTSSATRASRPLLVQRIPLAAADARTTTRATRPRVRPRLALVVRNARAQAWAYEVELAQRTALTLVEVRAATRADRALLHGPFRPTVPPERTARVAADARGLRVQAQARRMSVSSEGRRLAVAGEARRVSVAADPRTITT